jgi:histidinol-phosphate aminotransferase
MTLKTENYVSRRKFLKLSSALPLGAAALPAMARAGFAAPPATTERAASGGPAVGYIDTPANVTLLNINEFPAGPTPAAVDIMTRMATSGNRYYMSETRQFTQEIAAYHGVKPANVTLYAGSSEPLQFTTMAFTSPTRSFVTADPSYENGANTAAAGGAAVHKIPLKADYTHDIKAMAAADPNAGLFYICNPNNPTGVPIKRTEIEWLLENKPTGSVDLVAKDKDLVVIRTFSKIYAMGGLRFGYAVGRQDLLAKLHFYGINFMATTAVQCAKVQLNDKQLIPARKQMIADNRNRTLDFLAKQGYTATPSQTNCFMVDVKRPGRSVATALAHQNVVIGRSWAIWPNSVRVSVGSAQDMAAFQTAFVEAMKMPAEKMSQLVHPYPHLLEEPVC